MPDFKSLCNFHIHFENEMSLRSSWFIECLNHKTCASCWHKMFFVFSCILMLMNTCLPVPLREDGEEVLDLAAHDYQQAQQQARHRGEHDGQWPLATSKSTKKDMNVKHVKLMIMMMMLIMCEIIHRMSNVLLHSFVPSKIIKEKTRCTIATSMMNNTTMWFLSTPFRSPEFIEIFRTTFLVFYLLWYPIYFLPARAVPSVSPGSRSCLSPWTWSS